MASPKKICRCGTGYRSAYDGKCGHCRGRKAQKQLDSLHYQYPAHIVREIYNGKKRFAI